MKSFLFRKALLFYITILYPVPYSFVPTSYSIIVQPTVTVSYVILYKFSINRHILSNSVTYL